MSGKVYVVQETPGRNLVPALQYGEVEVLLPPGQVAFSSVPTVRRLNHNLRNFSDEDYLLMMGDPVAIALAGAVAARYNGGRMNILKWDKQERRYIVVKVDLNGGSIDG